MRLSGTPAERVRRATGDGRRRRTPAIALAVALASMPALIDGPSPVAASDRAQPRPPVEVLAAGVQHTELAQVGDERPVVGDLVTVDLRNPRVSVDLLTPGAVAARRPVSEMADEAGAVAGVNGDFFNINETNAPVGPAIADGEDLKGAVPLGQRYGPGAPGLSTEDVLTVGTDRVARLDRLRLRGAAVTADGTIPLAGLNQYAVAVDGVGAFTPAWGDASRRRSTCGTDTDRGAPCSADTAEVVVTRGVVTAVRDEVGSGPIPARSFVLVGRERGADTLRDRLPVGERVLLHQDLVAQSSRRPIEAAVGGAPILRAGRPIAGLDDTALAPRTAAGISADGRRLYLLTVDGRSTASGGLTVSELAHVMLDLGAHTALNLDGGGSSTLVTRDTDEDEVTVQNVPSDGAERPVPNGLGVFVGPGRR